MGSYNVLCGNFSLYNITETRVLAASEILFCYNLFSLYRFILIINIT